LILFFYLFFFFFFFFQEKELERQQVLLQEEEEADWVRMETRDVKLKRGKNNEKIEKLIAEAARKSEGYAVEQMLHLHSELNALCYDDDGDDMAGKQKRIAEKLQSIN
jgi:hypothetical protein